MLQSTMELLLVMLLSGWALSAPIHSIYQRDVSHLSPPSTRYGVPERRISAPYPPPAPVEEYGPPKNDEPVEPTNEYGPPKHDEPAEPSHEYGPPANDYLPPPPPPQIPSLPEVVVSHPYPPAADPVQEYGPPQQDVVAPVNEYGPPQQDFVAPVNEYGPPVEAIQDSVVQGPYPPPLFDSRYGAPTH